jgi:hypothetical protein
MTNQQLYLAIGLPILVYLLSFSGMIFALVWQTKDLREDIRSLAVKIDLLTGKVAELDTRVAVLEERWKR